VDEGSRLESDRGETLRGFESYCFRVNFYSTPQHRSVRVRSVTTTEYDDYGNVVRTVTIDEYELRPNITWTTNVWYSVDGNGVTQINP
jgi:hypothetical protein